MKEFRIHPTLLPKQHLNRPYKESNNLKEKRQVHITSFNEDFPGRERERESFSSAAHKKPTKRTEEMPIFI